MRNKVLGCLGIGAGVLLILSLMANVVLLVVSFRGGDQSTRGLRETQILEGASPLTTEKIVQIDVEGIITNMAGSGFGGSMVERLKGALRQAADDDDVKAVVLRINSPGGEVTASDVLYNAVRQLDETKPVIVYMDSVAASGGYYIACGARTLIANDTTITGSIGVIMAALNYSELMDRFGLDTMVFKSGDYKDTMRGSRAMREDEREYIQAQVDQIFEKFLGIVAAERNIAPDILRDGIADGRIFSGADAAANGLIDDTGYIEDAYEAARTAGLAPGAKIVRYQLGASLADLLGMFGEARAEPARDGVKINLLPGLAGELEPGKAYFLPAAFLP